MMIGKRVATAFLALGPMDLRRLRLTGGSRFVRRVWALASVAVLAAALLAYGGASAPTAAHAADDVITVPAFGPTAYQFQGFGVSLAWWANVVGGFSPAQRGQIEDALFSPSTPDNPNRLGLNVLRYNIGATAALGNPPAPDTSVLPSNCQTWPEAGRAVPVVQPGPGQPINLALDTNQIRVLTEAISRVTTGGQRPQLEAFANSAPWWMTTSGCSQGNGGTLTIPTTNIQFPAALDNLTSEAQDIAFARYVVSVLKAFRDQEGITFDSVDPLNEPTNPWLPNGPQNKQEGMKLGTAGSDGTLGGQQIVIDELCGQLRDAGMSDTGISAPDGFNPDGLGNQSNTPTVAGFLDAFDDSTSKNLNAYPQGTRDCLAQINTHMYDVRVNVNGLNVTKDLIPYAGSGRRALRDTVAGLNTPGQPPKRIWMSEFGNSGGPADIGSGIAVASQITRDLRYLRPSAWVYWQAVGSAESNSDSLIAAPGFPSEDGLAPDFPNSVNLAPNPGSGFSGFITPTKRYFALEQFSRFIRPGDWIVSALDPQDNASAEQASTVAAFDPIAHTLTIVTTNDSSRPRTPTYDLTGFEPQLTGGNVDVFRTDANLNVNHDAQQLQLTGGQFTDTQQPNSINTYVVGLPGLPGTGFPPNQPPVVSAGPPVTGDETSAISLGGSATDPDGDPLRISWSASPAAGTTDPGASCTFADPTAPQTTVTCSDEGVYRLTLTADDGVNLPISSSTTVTVNNVGPSITLTSPPPWQPLQAPAAVSLTAPITDPGANDTHTCTINWDDGTTETFAQEGNCNRTHTYTAPGVYTIKVTVTDDDQHSATASGIVVVFDPGAGFVTGGGHIDSPAGAYTPDPSVAGKVHFVMQADYPSGSTTPTGNVKVRIQDINLEMDATSLDWLVISPNGEAAVKGSGTMGGQDVRFIMYGYQGCGGNPAPGCQPGSDSFRVVIWPSAQGANPTAPFIYDNVPGADLELADATPQPLSGGNIQIHA
jgi:PKD domain-containing protein